MAIKPADYTYSNPASADYPYGSAVNASAPGATDGTPADEGWVNDMFGFHQALLSAAGIVASGAPDNAQVSQLRDAVEALMWSPGDYKPACYSTPGRRWLECAGGSVGNAASGATARANADTLALFTKLWGEPAYTILDSTGAPTVRGASAAVDFAANKRMSLPDTRGGALVGWDHGRGADAGRLLGTWSSGAVKSHTHLIDFTGHTSDGTGGGGLVATGAGYDEGITAFNTGSTGGDINLAAGVSVMWLIRY